MFASRTKHWSAKNKNLHWFILIVNKMSIMTKIRCACIKCILFREGQSGIWTVVYNVVEQIMLYLLWENIVEEKRALRKRSSLKPMQLAIGCQIICLHRACTRSLLRNLWEAKTIWPWNSSNTALLKTKSAWYNIEVEQSQRRNSEPRKPRAMTDSVERCLDAGQLSSLQA